MRLFLIGMPGSGKSTIGRQLAESLECSFADLDDLIETDLKKSIRDVFSDEGESFFRDYEASTLRDFANRKDNFLLATGGGTPCYRRSMNFIRKTGKSIYLQYGAEVLASRVWKNGLEVRPTLSSQKRLSSLEKTMSTKLKRRAMYYEKADLIFELTSETPAEVVRMIIKKL